MIRVAMVIPTLDQSGAERQMSLLAAGLPQDRFQVRVFSLNRGGYYEQWLSEAGVPCEIMGKRFRFDVLTGWRMRSAVRRFQPHIVQSFLFAANAYVRLPGICPHGARVIVSERCVDSWKSAWQLWLDRRLFRRTAAMTANSASVAEFYRLAGIPPAKITVIPNAVPAFDGERDRAWIRTELGLQASDRIVGFTGRLAPQKGLPDMIWAFQLLHQVVDQVRLVLLGDGPERHALAELARNFGCRDKIVFAGHREDAYRMMQGMDVFCLPSRFEGMSNSLMEAMSLGLPVVASDISANRELVTSQQTGLLAPVGDAPELARSLKRVLDDSALAARLGCKARSYIASQHSVDQLINRHVQLYEQVLASPAIS